MKYFTKDQIKNNLEKFILHLLLLNKKELIYLYQHK
jgi:hypothetical protein